MSKEFANSFTGRQERALIPKEYRQKVHFVKKLLKEESMPLTQEGEKMILNVITIGTNCANIKKDSELVETMRKVLLSPTEPDIFQYQEYGHTIASHLTKGVKNMDMVDLICAAKVMDYFTVPLLGAPSKRSDSSGKRYHDLTDAYVRELVHSVTNEHIRGYGEFSLPSVGEILFGDSEHDINSITNKAERMMSEKIIIGDLIYNGGLYNTATKKGGSSYSEPLSNKKRDTLNEAAADTLEKLHLLKYYGISSFEVRGEDVDLPWDIAVTPPTEIKGGKSLETKSTPGAIADFLFLSPNDNRESTLLDVKQSEFDERVTNISLGVEPTLMRFRLHDNGQISHGSYYHNIPSDLTEKTFVDFMAHDAFQRIRGLFIALAFDAVVPDDVTKGEAVGGSVGGTFTRNAPTEKPITELLLRRRKALSKAGITKEQRQPKNWGAPKTQDVSGHFKPLLPGTRARATAETEAREHYEAVLGRTFPGLPENHTWVGGYKRSTPYEITYRRAHFRPDSATAIFKQKNKE